MSPQSCTDAVRPGAARTCTACHRMRALDQFERIDPGQGTIDRRRICTPCLQSVDDLLRSGATNISDIHRRTGVSAKVIRARRDLLETTPRPYRRLNDIDALTELTLARKTPAEIAAALNVADHTVRRHQLRLGLRDTDSARARVPDEVLVRAGDLLRDEGLSYREVARTVHVDVDTLRRHFPGHGWTSEDRSVMASIVADPDLRRLHDLLQASEL